jgi:tetratricopeptide (TPR) repeat protein
VVMAKGFEHLVGLVVGLSVGLTSIAAEAKTAAKPDVFPPVVLELPKFSNAIEEAQALGAVGLVAWEKGETPKVRAVTERLQGIQAKNPPTIDLLEAIAASYRQIRKQDLALLAYNAELQLIRQQNLGALPEFNVLNAIAQLHLEWFGYSKAEQSYNELLGQASSAQDLPNQVAYLYQLAYIHEESRQPKAAADALARLIPLYQTQLAQTQALPVLLPLMKLRLADNYRALKDFDQAERAYQDCFTVAQGLVQFSYAQEALHHLGQLYEMGDRTDSAIQVYDFLTTFEQEQLLDYYSAMGSYDRLSQLYGKKGDRQKAIAAAGQGLALAQKLKLRVAEFEQKLKQLQG